MAKVIAEITEIRGTGECSAGHRVGEKFVFGDHAPGGLCVWAMSALLPAVTVLLNGGRFAWAERHAPTVWACPDSTETVVFRLTVEDGHGAP